MTDEKQKRDAEFFGESGASFETDHEHEELLREREERELALERAFDGDRAAQGVEDCPECHGTGLAPVPDERHAALLGEIVCDNCNGRGTILTRAARQREASPDGL